jgi:hypothetical protein
VRVCILIATEGIRGENVSRDFFEKKIRGIFCALRQFLRIEKKTYEEKSEAGITIWQ